MAFLSEDVEKARQFGEFIHKCARWEMTTAEAISLTKHFVWFNQTVKKIEEHVFEIQKVISRPAESTSEQEAK